MALFKHINNPLQLIDRKVLKIVILVITSALTLASLVMTVTNSQSYLALEAGDVAPQDIQAPVTLSYTSAVLTEQRQMEAEQRVSNVYLPADPAIARRQIELLRASLNFVNSVRSDTFATREQKLTDLAALENIQLNREDAEWLLVLNESRWQLVQQESLSVLERAMRNTIRETQVMDAQRGIPGLISFSLPQDLADIVTTLVSPFVVPNSLYSPELTAQAREEARAASGTVTITYIGGETIVRRGQIITAAHREALEEYGLVAAPDNYKDILSVVSLVAVITGFTVMFFIRRKLPVMESVRSLGLISLVFLLFLYGARLALPNHTVLPYLYPIPAFGLTIACLFNIELSLIISLLLSILAAFGLPNSLDLTLFYAISSMFGILILGKGHRIGSFFWAGMGVGAAGSAVIIAYRLIDSSTDLVGIATLTGTVFLNGVASASLTLLLQFLFSNLLGIATPLQLLEISRPDHPLQQFILRNAPGSYQHSLQVANLAEQAAEKIGADAMLVRVGAIYHDAGKALNPSFFIENQVPGKLNPHDDLDPAVSAQTIIRHVSDGVQLARKYRLPSRMMDFMREHHGTHMTRYQYAKALKEADNDPEKVDLSLFTYPGPRPQTRETALLMLADGCQAKARAEIPQDDEELYKLVRSVIEYCEKEGQLDDTRLTLRDLNTITDSFVHTLRNTYHPRIRYPEATPAAESSTQNTVPLASLQTTTPDTSTPATVEAPSISPAASPNGEPSAEEESPSTGHRLLNSPNS